jgi:hypothetical protein
MDIYVTIYIKCSANIASLFWDAGFSESLVNYKYQQENTVSPYVGTVKALNFDRESHKKCFMAQEWDPLSKDNNKSGIFTEMQKKFKVGVTVSFVHFSSCRF